MSAIILAGDCRELMRAMPESSIDSIVTDPPYELTSARPGGRSPATRGAVMKGFMGMEWDGSGVAYDVAMWADALRVIKPGGHLLAFGGSRTYHRMACAIEDAGFELRDQIMWLYGSGFPKGGSDDGIGTCLKPAHEPIVMARKPCIGSARANIARIGTGGLNIDVCRIDYDMLDTNPATNPLHRKLAGYANGNASDEGSSSFSLKDGSGERNPNTLGRWPANVIHDGSDEVVDAFPQAPGQLADSKLSGERKTSNVYGVMRYANGRNGEQSAESANAGATGLKMRPGARRQDSGSAARFFYAAKASKADRDEGLETFAPQQFVQFQTGNGESGQASSLSEGRDTVYRNIHPTVKPENLMRYLVRLVTPVGGLVLDPFAGSGSTGKAAVLEGRSFVGCELTAEYIPIAEARIAAAVARLADEERKKADQHPDLFGEAA